MSGSADLTAVRSPRGDRNAGIARPPDPAKGSRAPAELKLPLDSRTRRLLISLAILIAGVVFVLPVGEIVAAIDYHAMTIALRRTPGFAIALSVAATTVSFAALVGRDASALRYIGARTSFTALFLASFCGSALGNAAGFGVLTAGAVRYRIYGASGVKRDDVARLLIFVTGGFALGLSGVGGLAALVELNPVFCGWSPAPRSLRPCSF
jgi:phosphatidylglycerol lysyltransferase